MDAEGPRRGADWRRWAAEITPVVGRLPRYARLAKGLLAHREDLGSKPRYLLLAGLAYLLSPIDLIPGVFPVIGQMDDLLAALYALRLALDAMPVAVRDRILAEAGLTREQVEEDWRTVCRLGQEVFTTGGRAALRAVGWLGRRLAAGVVRAGRRARR